MKKNIILDFDSTIVTIEGIDELARIKGVYQKINKLTNQAMNGEIGLEDVFDLRLQLIKPQLNDLKKVAKVYRKHITKHARRFIYNLQIDHNIFVVSGGYEQAILLTTRRLGIADSFVFANRLMFDKNGNYLDFDRTIPLWQQNGKAQVIEQIKRRYPYKTIIIGDGISDAKAKTADDLFVQFKVVVNRPTVAKHADNIVEEFSEELINYICD